MNAGTIVGKCTARRRASELRKFLDEIERNVPGQPRRSYRHGQLRNPQDQTKRPRWHVHGFGRQVKNPLSRRAQPLVEMGLATTRDDNTHTPVRTLATVEQQEVEHVGH